MTNTVIFDLDGLLVDSEKTWYLVMKDILKECGWDLTLEEYVGSYSGKTITDNMTSIIEQFQMQWQLEEAIQKAADAEGKYVKNGIDLKPGARELLEYLNAGNYKVVLGTSSTRERALEILEYHQIVQYFDDFVVGYDVERSKPFPDIFLAASAKVHSNPKECLVLEDSEAGIQAAFAAGIPVICVPDLKRPKEEYEAMTTAMASSLYDVIDYLEEDRKLER